MKKTSLTLILIWITICCHAGNFPKLPERNLNFVVLSDMGEKTDSLRRKAMVLADNLNGIVKNNPIAFVIIAGDTIHDSGVKSAADPEWKFKLTDVYERDALMNIPWHAVPGNHEYRGNPDAVADYSSAQSWWESPSRYYDLDEGKVKILMLDTTPMIDRYKCEKKGLVPEGYVEKQLQWVDSTLTASRARWNIVIGHHPIYSNTGKNSVEREDMRRRLLPLLEKNGVRLYINGHIHNFQHICKGDSRIHFVTNPSSVKYRKPVPEDGTLFCGSGPGYSVYSVSRRFIKVYFVNGEADVVYSARIGRK